MAYNATDVCNNLLERSFQEKVPLTQLKLQKMMYFAASEYMKKTEHPLVGEQFQAWKFGPVLRSIYAEFSSFGPRNINKYAQDAQGQAYGIDETEDIELGMVLDRVWSATKNLSAARLVDITHSLGSAWYNAWVNGEQYISDDAIGNDATYRQPLALA